MRSRRYNYNIRVKSLWLKFRGKLELLAVDAGFTSHPGLSLPPVSGKTCIHCYSV